MHHNVSDTLVMHLCARSSIAVTQASFFLRKFSVSVGDIRYTKDHEYVKLEEGGVGVVGISVYAQSQLGDVVYVDLPETGAKFAVGEAFGAVESVKAASDLFSPVSGEVTDANTNLSDTPALVNTSPEGEGWMVKMKLSEISQLDGLMDTAAYKSFCEDS